MHGYIHKKQSPKNPATMKHKPTHCGGDPNLNKNSQSVEQLKRTAEHRGNNPGSHGGKKMSY